MYSWSLVIAYALWVLGCQIMKRLIWEWICTLKSSPLTTNALWCSLLTLMWPFCLSMPTHLCNANNYGFALESKMSFGTHQYARWHSSLILICATGFQTLIGCDATSGLSHIGKRKAWKALKDSPGTHADMLYLADKTTPSIETFRTCKRFLFPTTRLLRELEWNTTPRSLKGSWRMKISNQHQTVSITS